jgi:signal transduction histidine kinase
MKRRIRLATRLFLTQSLVVIAGALTLVLVAIAVAPGLFHQRVGHMTGMGMMGADFDRSLGIALLLSLAIAVSAALVIALAVSWLTTNRLSRPINDTVAAAIRIADGDYAARVPDSRLGVEFASLDNAFNRMARTLQDTSRRRRELLADLAHELRTPVATLDSFLEAIEDGVIAPEPETWQTMREQTARLGRLVNDVDQLSRAEEGELDLRPRRLDADDVIADAVRAASAHYQDMGVTLRHDRAPIAAGVQADPDRCQEILHNLLNNAVRHTPPGGTVTVAATTAGGRVRISVTDTGEGIAPEHLPHVFERFYRADPARSRRTGGSGIGLTIARALARAHGGDLRAASDGLGRGATFTLVLPAL